MRWDNSAYLLTYLSSYDASGYPRNVTEYCATKNIRFLFVCGFRCASYSMYVLENVPKNQRRDWHHRGMYGRSEHKELGGVSVASKLYLVE